MKKRIISLVLAVALVLSNVTYVSAAEASVTDTLKQEIAEKEEALADAKAEYDALVAEGEAKDAELAALEKEIAEVKKQELAAKRALAILNASVTGVTITASNNKVTTSWKAISNVDYYKVTLYGNGKVYKSATTTGTTYAWSEVARGVKYKVQVVPVVKYKIASLSSDEFTGKAAVSKEVTYKLSKPSFTMKKSGKYQVLKANDQNSTGYQVYIAKDKKFKKSVKKYKFKTSEKALSKKIKTSSYFKSGRKYVKVRAYTTVNGKTIYSPWSSVKTKK